MLPQAKPACQTCGATRVNDVFRRWQGEPTILRQHWLVRRICGSWRPLRLCTNLTNIRPRSATTSLTKRSAYGIILFRNQPVAYLVKELLFALSENYTINPPMRQPAHPSRTGFGFSTPVQRSLPPVGYAPQNRRFVLSAAQWSVRTRQ